jgi:outer membrane protein assembly factor BamB
MRIVRHTPKSLLVLALLLPAAPMYAQEPAAVRKIALPNLDSQVAAKLHALDAQLNPVHSPELAAAVVTSSPFGAFAMVLTDRRNNEIWERAADDYYRLMQESGEALVTADKGTGAAWTSNQVRRLCHQRLASLPRASLAIYRQRVDAEARALLEQGKQSRSPIPLRRLVDELFCSSYGDQALDLLGDLAFERGQFEEAAHWWNVLAPNGSAKGDRLHYPDPKVDLVRTQAKQILAMIFDGRLNDARGAIDDFADRHPRAEGHLAGQTGVLHRTLTRTLDAFRKERIANNDEPWPTFAGDATRNRVLSQGLSWHLWEDGPAWRVPLPALFDAPERSSLTRRAAFHPVIVNEQVLIADHRSVVSHHLTTGKPLFRFDLKSAKLVDPGPIHDEDRLPRFTLSADRSRAYVRLGRLGIGPKITGDKGQPSYLVCLDLSQPSVDKNRLLWHIKTNVDDHETAFFEGSPLVHDGRVYIALSKFANGLVTTSIVCYDVLGRQRWSREVCACPEFEEKANGPRYRQHLLTLAAGQLIYCSHSGAIVAVDARTGQPTWGVRYESRGPLRSDFEPSPRDLAPCLYADGCVYVAPLDSDRCFCIDATNGQVRWDCDGTEIVHLLGATHGRLFVATRNGVQAMRSDNGQVAWAQPSDGRLPSLGRGVIAGGWLFWPTQDTQLPGRAITLSEGHLRRGDDTSVLPEPEYFEPTMLTGVPAGNWAFGQGCLAVAGLSELVVFVPPDRQPNRFPMDPRPNARLDQLYRDARTHAYAGRTEAAIDSYKQWLVVQAASPARQNDWRRLVDYRIRALSVPKPMVVTPRSSDQWLSLGETSFRAKQYGQAADAFRRLLLQKTDDDRQARGLHGLAKSYEAQREYRSAWQTWTALERQFGDKTPIPSAKQEPYRTALAMDVPASPSLPLVQSWSHDGGRILQVDSQDARAEIFFCTNEGSVACRSLADGTARWQRQLDFDPTWLGRWHDLVVVAGPDMVRTLRVDDGATAWSFAAPSRRFQPWTLVAGKPKLEHASAGFVHIERWDDSLLLLDDGRHFFRVSLATGETTWHHADAATDLRPLGKTAYEPKLTRVDGTLLVQSISGQPCWLDAAKPTPVGAKARPWAQSPELVKDCVVVAGERGRIVAYERKSPHRVAWTYQAPFAPSLSGEPCRLIGKGSVLLALVPRNDGVDCIRLDVATGKPIWTVPGRLLSDVDADSICVGDTSVYFVAANSLCARSLNDGRAQWTQSLPSGFGHWAVGYAKDYLTVHPADDSQEREFFVALADPWDGKWLQKLACPGARGRGAVMVTPGRVLASAGGRIFGFHTLPLE